MKRTLFFIVLVVMAITGSAQESDEDDIVAPSFNTEIERNCIVLNIEGENFFNVNVSLKSSDLFTLFDNPTVKVIVKNERGKKIYKKIFPHSCLYINKEGFVMVGFKSIKRLLITRGEEYGYHWVGVIREKEGIWPK